MLSRFCPLFFPFFNYFVHIFIATGFDSYFLVTQRFIFSCTFFHPLFLLFGIASSAVGFFVTVVIKQLLDEVEHDIMNYQNRGLIC